MGSFFKAWLNFDTMITPKIITVVYWILIVSTVVGSIFMMLGHFLAGMIGLITGLIGVRVGCELVILSFNIYKCLKKIADNSPDTLPAQANDDSTTLSE